MTNLGGRCPVVDWCGSDHDRLLEDWTPEPDGTLRREHEAHARYGSAYLVTAESIGPDGARTGPPEVVVGEMRLATHEARVFATELLRLAAIADGGQAAEPPAQRDRSDDALLDLIELDMRARACRPRSIKEMRATVKAFARHARKALIQATRDDVISYLTRDGLKPVTIRTYRTALSTFYRFLVDEGLLTANPTARLPKVKLPHTEPAPLSTEEIQRLLDSGIRRRTRMMVLLAAYQGLRAVEISQVRGDAIDWRRMQLTVRGGKGGTELVRPLHSAVADYARTGGFPEHDWWFPGNGNEHVSAQAVSMVIARALERAGIVGHRPHQIRAWHATELIEAGADAVTVQYSMRHSNLSSLHKYARPSNDRIRNAIETLPPLEPNR